MNANTLQALLDQQAICEALWRYCRTLDRVDREGALALWCEDARAIYHGMYEGAGHDFVDWVWEQHSSGMHRHYHLITNVRVETDGDEAKSEASVTVTLWMLPETPPLQTRVCGRYLDRWRREQGAWRIAHREFVADTQSTLAPQAMESAAAASQGRNDASYRFLSD